MPARALIVVDVQNEYVTGKMPITFPDVSESLANVGRAMDVAREHAMPIVVIQQSEDEDAVVFARGSDGFALHDVVAQRPYDELLAKELPSAFPETGLEAWLRARDVDTLVVVGFMTQHCVESTIRDAMHRGFDVELLADAAGSLDLSDEAGSRSAREIHETACVVLQTGFAAVSSTAQWIDAVRAGQSPPRSNVFVASRRA